MAFVLSDDCSDDGCSICLEPFSSHDPSTVTKCKHEYHLHCILEWSQRSTECPICCQFLSLKDPSSQELLRAAQRERSLRSKNNTRIVREVHEVSHVPPYADDPDLEERILQHFAAVSTSIRYAGQRGRQISSGTNSSDVFPAVSFSAMSNVHSMNYRNDMDDVDYFTVSGFTPTHAPSTITEPELRRMSTVENGDGSATHRNYLGQSSPDGPGGSSSSSELTAFSESVKAKLSAASARYKESITKSTLSFKEKLLARNSTVKELGRGVQREMSAGIAGIARMIDRLDLSSKRTGDRATSESPRAVSGETVQINNTLS